MKLFQIFYSVFFNRCPQCHKGQVFQSKNPYALDKIFSMHHTCSNCGLKYEKESGFFYGAMYVSYALTSGWFILWFLLQNYLLNWDLLNFAIFISVTILLLSPLTIRWSRLIWMNFFFPFKKSDQRDLDQKI